MCTALKEMEPWKVCVLDKRYQLGNREITGVLRETCVIAMRWRGITWGAHWAFWNTIGSCVK